MTRVLAVVVLAALGAAPAASQTDATVTLRGKPQVLRLWGARGAQPILLSSSDGGWIHLGTHVAELLASKGYFVVGLDVKAYLESFTSGKTALRPEDEPGDYRVIAEFAARGSKAKPILVGVSEGAGLSVLAATDPATKALVGGVIGLGLPDLTELGWRWRDAIIWITKGVPHEPTFSTAAVIDKVAPLPLAAIHSTHDEFVPLAQIQAVIGRAKEPKKLWIVEASNHRFSDNLAEFDRRLIEAIQWVRSQGAEPR
jgi:Bacterial virulence protein (VirJ)